MRLWAKKSLRLKSQEKQTIQLMAKPECNNALPCLKALAKSGLVHIIVPGYPKLLQIVKYII